MISIALVGAVAALLQLDSTGLRHSTPLSAQVSLLLAADRDSYLRGDVLGLRISVENRSQAPVTAYFAVDPAKAGGTTIYYRRAGSATFSKLTYLNAHDDLMGPDERTLQPHERLTVEVPVSVTSYEVGAREFVLGQPGQYEFKVVYQDTAGDPNGVLQSAILAVNVVEPPTSERAAQAAYTPDLAVFAQLQFGRGGFTIDEVLAAADFLRRFPESQYTPPVKRGLRFYLDTRKRRQVATAQELALWQELFADETPPTLSVSATPSLLWPPNHKLVPITVAVTVSDDQDPSPTVRLVSVTCDDGCDASSDVSEAALGTDDRQFQFRAERLGTGSGRTYTIKYSATDASGNTTTKTTTVTVPHDQRAGSQ